MLLLLLIEIHSRGAKAKLLRAYVRASKCLRLMAYLWQYKLCQIHTARASIFISKFKMQEDDVELGDEEDQLIFIFRAQL